MSEGGNTESVIVSLAYPLESEGAVRDHVVMRRATMKDRRAAWAFSGADVGSFEEHIYSSLLGIAPADVGALDIADFEAIDAAYAKLHSLRDAKVWHVPDDALRGTSVSIPLVRPVVIDGVKRDVLHMRRTKVRDVRAVEREFGEQSVEIQNFHLYCALLGVTSDALDLLDVEDYDEIARVCRRFRAVRGPTDGQRSEGAGEAAVAGNGSQS